MAELRCEHVAASYGQDPVLSELDLVVPAGTLTAILGPSGCGKTTLLRVVMGFTRPQAGRVVVGGSVVADAERTNLRPEARGVGYVAQEGALYPHLTVGQNVAFGLPRSERKSSPRVAEVLRLVGLDERYASRSPGQLSGGEQRRVSLARALAPRPRAVLLDEPFSGLDAALRVETRRAVLDALSREGATAVLVTHDQAEALSMGREVAVLRDGRLVQTASPADLYRSPADLAVARFVGEAVVLDGHCDAGTVTCPLGVLPAAGPATGARVPDGPVQVMLRPEQIRLKPVPCTGWPGGAVVATVEALTYLGSDTSAELRVGNSGPTVMARTYSIDAPRVGDVVELSVTGPAVVYPAPTGLAGVTGS